MMIKNRKVVLLLCSCICLSIMMSCGKKDNNIEPDDSDQIEEVQATETVTETPKQEETNIEKEEPKEEKHEADENKAEIVNNNNAAKKTVVIDPGHGGGSNLEKEKQSPDSNILKIKDGGGCEGVSTHVREAQVNLQVSMKLKALLEANNINVIMTRTDDSRSIGNIERAEVGNKNNAALSIRIHCDSADSSGASGATMLVPGNTGYAKEISSQSMQYGKTILDSLVNKAGMKNRGISVRNDMTGFNWSKVPVVLIELGFMSNPSEDRMLVNDEYQNKLAQGLCDGILKTLK